MLDNLRDQAASSQFEEEVVPVQEEVEPPKPSLDQVLGMNAQQRFFLSVMLLFVVCLLGVMFLFVTGKIVLPFLY
ncbi:MAG: hypothetical protein CO064_05550 [Anaerolineae bacterium CG_4_9_14_0_8_um_filter_58_9]|nr:MAG: hypothetical protein CO064_05550 [Anaerolineae bacterium CG_4_9_14_0_8_um_filter_58_9]